jgi:hypothetical protein
MWRQSSYKQIGHDKKYAPRYIFFRPSEFALRFRGQMSFFSTVKSPDSPSERPSRSYSDPGEPGPGRSDERTDRDYDDLYYDRPSRSNRGSGLRNLLLGVLFLGIAGAVFLKGMMLTGAKMGPPLAATLVTLLVLFVLARARLLNQRNGGFLALGLVLLMASLVPLGEYALTHVPVPGPLADKSATAPPPPPSAEPQTSEPELPLLTKSFPVGQASEQAARFKVLRDLSVQMGDGKSYMIKAGEVLPVADTAPGEVHFVAGDQKIALTSDTVEMIPAAGALPGGTLSPGTATQAPDLFPPAPAAGAQSEKPAQITERAQKEAIRRYPALGQIDSPENKLFRDTYTEMRQSGANDFFADPLWPLQLAELLAKREKWQRQP